MKLLILAPLLLAGCAMSPQQMAAQSTFDVCRLGMGGPHSQVAQQEANRRGVDCAPYYGAILARQANENAATANIMRALNPPAPQVIAPQQTNCTSRRVGNTVQTQCW